MASLSRRLSFAMCEATQFGGLATRRQSTHNADDYQYMERSVIPTMHFQNSLPRLPIPKLEKTCANYLAGLRPLLDEQQYVTAERLTKEFMLTSGARLDHDLRTWYKRNKHTSYITEPWFDMYFRSRVPLPINHNPFLVWTKFDNADQLSVATNLLVSSCRFKRSLDHNCLRPEIFHLNPGKTDTKGFQKLLSSLPSSVAWLVAALRGAYPLDMSQYRFLFNTSRIPVLVKDQLFTDRSATHAIVMRKGHFYSVDVFDQTGCIRAPEEIHACLDFILNDPRNASPSAVGLFTTMDRDNWSLVRSRLLLVDGNEEALHRISGALLVLNLDTLQSDDASAVTKNFLHGDGVNRWFDKSMQLIVCADGLAGVNFEHSWGDGVAVLRFMEDVSRDVRRNWWIKAGQPADKTRSPGVQRLELKLDKPLEEVLEETGQKYKSWCAELAVGVLQKPRMNREYLKSKQVSPDAVMQLAIQLAFRRIHGVTAATYESCSTAAFKHGRTETVRPVTLCSRRFVDAMLVEKPSKSELKKLLRECCSIHKGLVKQASMGQGFDRHMFAMRVLAERRGDRLPELYLDETYRLANDFVLSTSSLSSECILLGGFGPVVLDGYGVGYTINKEKLACLLTTYKTRRDGEQFIKSLSQSLDDIDELLT